jgi:hypothetical protein
MILLKAEAPIARIISWSYWVPGPKIVLTQIIYLRLSYYV